MSSENGISSTLKKLALSQQTHSNLNASKYYQAFTNYFNHQSGDTATTTNPSSATNGKVDSSKSSFKKLIKVQDCTTWLTMNKSVRNNSNQANGTTPYHANHGNLTSRNGYVQQFQNNNTNNTQNFTGYKIIDPNYNYANRINLLLNRKISRSNT